eukprot:2407212-Heterocapsa_arctica.AAC.1
MLVLSDDTHFVIGVLRQALRLGWSVGDRRHERVNSLVRLLDWETIERQGQAVVFVNRMTTYSGPSAASRGPLQQDCDLTNRTIDT